MTPAPSGDAHELVGQQLGVYQIEAPLAIGAQSDCFRARDLYTDQIVALKLLPASLSTSRDAVARLRDELRRIARLRHPHLLPVVEVATERGLLYAIALLPTDSLHARFERDGLLSPQDAVRYAAELAWALHALHSAGLVHGDVQPDNMLFDTQAALRLADFGVPRALQRQRGKERPALPSRPLAARSYTAPEVAQGGEITSRSDIYSLGAVFYEMLIGNLPLVTPEGTSQGEEITTAPLPPSMRSSEDWPELAAVALKALAPDPSRRYADARAFAVALRTAVFTQQREDQRPSLIAALSGVFHAPVEGTGEATFIQRITGAPVPSAPMPDAPSAGPLDPRHLAYRSAPTPPPSAPAAFAPAPADPVVPPSEDEIATTLLDERLFARDAAAPASPASPFTPPASDEWSEDDIATMMLDRNHLDSSVASSMPPFASSLPLPPPSVPPRSEPSLAPGDPSPADLAAVWLAALESTAPATGYARSDELPALDASDALEALDALDDPEGVAPMMAPPTGELVDDLRRLAGGPSQSLNRRSRPNPGWVKALLATLGITVLAAASGFGILASTHAPNAAPGGPAIPTATTAPADTVSAATPEPTLPATTRPGNSHGSIYVFPTPTPIPPPPTATP